MCGCDMDMDTILLTGHIILRQIRYIILSNHNNQKYEFMIIL
jgi:hypothetical protein